MPHVSSVFERRRVLVALLGPALLVALLTTLGPLRSDPVANWAGVGLGYRPGRLPGFPTIDPNIGTTSFALGFRGALDLFSGRLPLWNHYEGLGAPLLGEMQSAPLFPPTWLLLLPYGQALEHALLQAVAGLGTFLFLRRFGLGVTAALAGGLLFEFNGVFAWLRNAVYNPVAFLPWLFYVVESLFRLERAGASGRWRMICLGAIAAALALYAGFPEVVYFYSLLLALWVALRAAELPWRRSIAFGAGLLAMGALALLIAAPLLLAFGGFLREAAVGGHHGVEFRNHHLPPQAFLAALLPYVYGPISAAPQAAIGAVWSDIGGYLGAAPLLLAVAGLVVSWRRAASWLLALWVVLAVGASHGVPILHDAFVALPLATIAAYSRYLDASWIFACVVLGAVFVDRVDALAPGDRRRVAAIAGAVVLGLFGVGLLFAWRVLAEVPPSGFALGAGAGLFGLCLLALRRPRPAAWLAGLAVVEAAAWFMLPFAFGGRFAAADRVLIDFLRSHAGLQRFAIASGSGLGPNFGSVFGIPAINYDDLPVPDRTARYAVERLDAPTDGVIFGHNAPAADEAERRALQAKFIAALPGYRDAGVRYILSLDGLHAKPAYPLAASGHVPVPLKPGQEAVLDIEGAASMASIGTVSIMIGTYFGAADGNLRVRLCQASRCVGGEVALASALDNRSVLIALDDRLTVGAGEKLRLTILKEGGRRDVALWMLPAPAAAARLDLAAAPAGYLPKVEWLDPADPKPILRTETTTVYELAAPRPYASAPGCRVDAESHDRIRAQCDAPSRLLRLEVFMAGWAALVNGADAPIVPVEDTFQGVDLPVGGSVVDFRYAPSGVRQSVPLALAALAACLVVLGRTRPAKLEQL